MKSIHLFSLFILVALAQLFIPAKMIFDQEDILKTGTAYKFKTQPIDPSDPFKGKYIYLNYEQNHVPSNDSTWKRNEIVHVLVKQDSLGFVKATNVVRDEPESMAYVTAKIDWYDDREQMVYFTFPFNEFYMNETKAYDAEVAHNQAQQDSLPSNTYALVYVLKGEGVLENVFINDIPISKYVEKE